jgi:hypothetical protein
MKRLILLIVLCGVSRLIPAQNIHHAIQWSDDAKMNRSMHFYRMRAVGYDHTGVYTLLFPSPPAPEQIVGGTSRIFLARITPDLQIVQHIPINLKSDEIEKEYEFTLWLNNELYVFSSFQNQRLKKTFLFAQAVDKNTLEVKDEIIKITEIDYSEHHKFKNADFNIQISPDSSKVLIHYALLDRSRSILDMGLTVYTNDFKPIWHSKNFSADNSNVFRFDEFVVNNSGDVFILGKSFDSRIDLLKHRRYKKVIRYWVWGDIRRMFEFPLYEYRIVALTHGGTRKQVFTPTINDRFIRQLSLVPVKEDKVLCTGVYSNKNSFSVIGNCSFIIDVGKNHITQSINPFTDAFIKEGLSKRQLQKFEKGKEFDVYLYYPGDLIAREDGGFYMLTELVEQRMEGNRVYIFDAFYYEDILVVSLDSNGETEWVRRIDRSMYAAMDGIRYSSFNAHLLNNDLYLVFAEYDKKPGSKRSQSSLARIDRQGNVSTEIIATAKTDGVTLMPRSAGNFCPESIFMMGRYNAKYRLLRIDLSNDASIK